MYKVFCVMDDRLVLQDMDDKSYYPMGYVVDKEFNIIGEKVAMANVVRFNPYVENPSNEDAKRKFRKDKGKFTEIS